MATDGFSTHAATDDDLRPGDLVVEVNNSMVGVVLQCYAEPYHVYWSNGLTERVELTRLRVLLLPDSTAHQSIHELLTIAKQLSAMKE